MLGPDARDVKPETNDAAPAWSPEELPESELSLERMEAALIRRALQVTRGNKGRAARALGIHRSTLYKKLEAYGIEPDA